MARCMVLNATYEFLAIEERWIDSLNLVLTGKATALEHYPETVHSFSASFKLPAVVVMRQVVRTKRSRRLFELPTRKIVFIRDGFRCQYCGVKVSMKTGTRDHVIPKSRGGADTLANVVTACQDCNVRKDDRTPEEAGMALVRTPRTLTEDEKLRCALRVCKTREREAWLEALNKHGITLWTA